MEFEFTALQMEILQLRNTGPVYPKPITRKTENSLSVGNNSFILSSDYDLNQGL